MFLCLRLYFVLQNQNKIPNSIFSPVSVPILTGKYKPVFEN
jgi:hypothetical protein